MAFKVCVLIGLALLCSYADAMGCLRFRDEDPGTCPVQSKNKNQEFCCYHWDLRPYCCDREGAIFNWSIIAILIIIPTILTLLCCLCCLCLPDFYKFIIILSIVMVLIMIGCCVWFICLPLFNILCKH